MNNKRYRPTLLSALRRTLDHLEREAGSANDPTLLELKASILRTLAQHQVEQENTGAAGINRAEEQFIN